MDYGGTTMGAGLGALGVQKLMVGHNYILEAQVLSAMTWGPSGFKVMGSQSLYGGPGWCILRLGG